MSTTTTHVKRPVSNDVLDTKIETVKGDISDIKITLREISTTMGTIATIEARQASIIRELEKGGAVHNNHHERISAIEVKMPQLEEARAWVIRGILAGVGMIFIAVASLVFKPQQPTYFVVDGKAQVPQLSQVPQVPQVPQLDHNK